MQHPRVTTSVYSINPENPNYTLTTQEDRNLSVIFNFETPTGNLTIKLPRYTQDRFGRRCHLSLACFCEGLLELRVVPIYWPREDPALTRPYHNRPRKG